MKNKKKLLVGLTGILVLGVCLFFTARTARRAFRWHRGTQPRADANALIQVGDLKRSYDFHVPSSYDPKKPIPVVFAFHGSAENGKLMQQVTQFNQLADREGFIAVYPDALALYDGEWDTQRKSELNQSNDVGFVAALIDDLGRRYSIDRNRIYATGFSNGGMFAQRLGCDLSDRIAAIATVAGSMPQKLAQQCNITRPIPVLIMHGTEDAIVLYSTPRWGLLSVADTFKNWRIHNQCSGQIAQTSVLNAPNVQIETQQCPNGTSTQLYTIKGGDHFWFGSTSVVGVSVSKATQAIDASSTVWKFFQQHPKSR